ncbi:hypothetical protein [Gemmatimonas sp.]
MSYWFKITRRTRTQLAVWIGATLIAATPATSSAQPSISAPRWELSATPVTVIADDGSDATQWRRLVGAVRLPNGDVLVGDMGTGVHRFAPDGRHIKLELRRGNGPLELPDVSALAPWGAGGVVTTANEYVTLGVPLPVKGGFTTGGGPPSGSLDAVFLDSSLLQLRSRWFELAPPTRVVRDSATLVVRAARAGVDTIARLPNATGLVLASAALSRGIGYGLVDGAPQLRVTGRDSVVWFGSTDSDYLHRVSIRDGRALTPQRVSLPLPAVAWSEPRRTAWAAFAVDSAQRPDTKVIAEAAWKRESLPPRAPRFRALVSDVRGGVWVERYPDRPSMPSSWLVVNAADRVVGQVTLPRVGRLPHVDTAHIVVGERDENDVERVAVYALKRK